jgi:predicted dehydrogenase
MKRRNFLGYTLAGAASIGLGAAAWKWSRGYPGLPPSERVNTALIGVGAMGINHLGNLIEVGMANLVAICDVDDANIAAALKKAADLGIPTPKVEKDFRKILEMPDVEAVLIATPDHWHALITIAACQAGKDVYVEKPLAHTILEGQTVLRVARETKRVVQVGTQQRSGSNYQEAIQYLHEGGIGKIHMARGWVSTIRMPLKEQPDSAPPEGVDYNLWLGPAPERPFNTNRFHYDWRWFWDYGTGELGNWGVHHLDIIRWGIKAHGPKSVDSQGGKMVFEDPTETPDTQVVTFDFDGTLVVWEHRTWSKESFHEKSDSGCIFYGTRGAMTVMRNGWEVHPSKEGEKGPSGGRAKMREDHLINFFKCVKNRQKPVADVEEGHLSTILCHIGNISHRINRKLEWDVEKECFLNDDEANALLTKTYRAPWSL